MRKQYPRRSRATNPDRAYQATLRAVETLTGRGPTDMTSEELATVEQLANALAALSSALVAATGEPLNDEQRACLLDPARADEARDMLDDMRDRMGLTDEACAAAHALIADRLA